MGDHPHAPRGIIFGNSSLMRSRHGSRHSILGTAELPAGDGEIHDGIVGDAKEDIENALSIAGALPELPPQMFHSKSSAKASKYSVKDTISSHFDSWRAHDIKVRVISLSGIICGVALAVLSHMGSSATVPSVGWYNALHIAVGLVCLAVERCCALAAVCSAQTYTAAALLGEDGLSLHHVAQCFGGLFSAMRCLFGDRQRLRKAKDHATIGRRANGLIMTATAGFIIAAATPILHVLLVLGTDFESTMSPITGFSCDIPSYATVQPVNFTSWVRGADYYLAGITTASMVANIGAESFVVAGIDADGHEELTRYQVEQHVQALRVQVACDEPVMVGAAKYDGIRPVAAGITDFAILNPTAECQDSFCLIKFHLWGYGADGSKTDCVASTQSVSVTGLSTIIRVAASRSFSDFTINSEVVGPADPNYASLWHRGAEHLDEVVGRWPRDGWAGGLAFELDGDPPFNGTILPEYANHIVYRFIGGLHRLTSGSYLHGGSVPCDGYAPLGAGTIQMPAYAHVLGLIFGGGAAALSLYTFISERDIQLMVGLRNYRRAVSAVESPLRFATLLDGSEAAHEFGKMCDHTPQALQRVGASTLVCMGGSIDVSGPVGHACISKVGAVDPFSATRSYTGRQSGKIRPGASAVFLKSGWHRPRPTFRRRLLKGKALLPPGSNGVEDHSES
ncbi:hypothetical protein HDU88_007313 [Geranomyces variabilis]|nr:hypothetical protein HDU88_007313 [Geranomyces variabilis]